MTDQIAQHGSGLELLSDICFDTVRRQYASRLDLEEIGVDARIMRDRDSACTVLLLDIVSQTLCRVTNDINIHSVGACAEYAAQSCRTEFQGSIEAIIDRVVIILDRVQLLDQFRVLGSLFKPFLVNVHIIHAITL